MEDVEQHLHRVDEELTLDDPYEVPNEASLLLPAAAIPQPAAPYDTEMEERLGGDYLEGDEYEAYRAVHGFFAAFGEPTLLEAFVAAEYRSSVRRRIERSGEPPGAVAWRIGVPRVSAGGASVRVRVFPDPDRVGGGGVIGEVHLDNSGQIEDIQIDFGRLGAQ